MVEHLDRILVVAMDRRPVVAAWRRLLDAEPVREDGVAVLAARRSVLRAGRSEVEVLEPDGLGPVARWLGRHGPGLFGVGLASADPAALEARWKRLGVSWLAEGEQLFLSAADVDIPGLRVVVSPREEREPAGLLRGLYEVTSLVADPGEAAARAAEVFGLDPSNFVPIHSEAYGYDGILTLFRAERLDRIEFVVPFDRAKTMGRYFRRRGPRLYMAYAESDDPARVRARLLVDAPSDWTGPRDAPVPDNLYVHPRALGGTMLGVSRTTFAWTWSGRPDRVETP
jgi:hypothetical protein